MKKIFLSSDHAGFKEKAEVISFIQQNFPQYQVIDLGTNSEVSVHYPLMAHRLCSELLKSADAENKGILICGTGIGMSITANKFQGIRAALCHSEEEARLAREHNDSNVLCLGSRTNHLDHIKSLISAWLKAEQCSGRHAERVKMINQLGQKID